MAENYITQDDRSNQYTALAAQTIFPVTYKFQQDEDLDVSIINPDDTITSLNLNVDYTVSGKGNDTGGSVILAEGATEGTVYRIRGEAERDLYQRLTSANYSRTTINSIFERCLIWIVEQWRDIDLIKTAYETFSTVTVPALLALGVTMTEQLESATDAAESASESALSAAATAKNIGNSVKVATNVTSLLTDTIFSFSAGAGIQVAVGDIIQTREEGFSYRVVSDINLNYHFTHNGIRLLALPDNEGMLCASQVGCPLDGESDDSVPFNRATNLLPIIARTTLGPYSEVVFRQGRLHIDSSVFRVLTEKVPLSAGVEYSGDPFNKRYFARGAENARLGTTILADITDGPSLEYVGGFLTFCGTTIKDLVISQTTKTEVVHPAVRIVGAAGMKRAGPSISTMSAPE